MALLWESQSGLCCSSVWETPVPSAKDSSSVPQPLASDPGDTALRLVYAPGSSILVPLTLGPRQAVERLEASGFSHDDDNHSYHHFPAGSPGLLASFTHREVVSVVVRSLGSGAGAESQSPYVSSMGP